MVKQTEKHEKNMEMVLRLRASGLGLVVACRDEGFKKKSRDPSPGVLVLNTYLGMHQEALNFTKSM